MIHKIGILILICLFTACSSSGQNEIPTTGELLRQAAFYRERLQFLPALETYRQAIGQAEKEKDSVALSIAYLETGKIYRKQSLKQKALENENVALSYILNPASDSLRLELYREIGDVYSLSGQADSAFYYYEKAGCRIKQAKILQQNGSYKEAETLLKEESGQTIPRKEKAEILSVPLDYSFMKNEEKLTMIERFKQHAGVKEVLLSDIGYMYGISGNGLTTEKGNENSWIDINIMAVPSNFFSFMNISIEQGSTPQTEKEIIVDRAWQEIQKKDVIGMNLYSRNTDYTICGISAPFQADVYNRSNGYAFVPYDSSGYIGHCYITVSYTHLTLPTICSV